MKVVFYTTGCPRCKILKKKLDAAKIDYEMCGDVRRMLEIGMKDVPVLEVDGVRYEFAEAVNWVNAEAQL